MYEILKFIWLFVDDILPDTASKPIIIGHTHFESKTYILETPYRNDFSQISFIIAATVGSSVYYYSGTKNMMLLSGTFLEMVDRYAACLTPNGKYYKLPEKLSRPFKDYKENTEFSGNILVDRLLNLNWEELNLESISPKHSTEICDFAAKIAEYIKNNKDTTRLIFSTIKQWADDRCWILMQEVLEHPSFYYNLDDSVESIIEATAPYENNLFESRREFIAGHLEFKLNSVADVLFRNFPFYAIKTRNGFLSYADSDPIQKARRFDSELITLYFIEDFKEKGFNVDEWEVEKIDELKMLEYF